MSANGRAWIDYTNKDYAALREAMLQLAREKLPAWSDHSPNDLGVLLVELFAAMGDLILYYQDRIANESFLDSACERRSVLNLLRLIGYELRPPQPASADLTLLFDVRAREETVTLETDTEFQAPTPVIGGPVGFRYVQPTRTIALRGLPTVPDGNRNYLQYESLPVVQVDAVIKGEVVGSSDGSSWQRFPLAQKPLIEDSLILSVNEGAAPRIWERQLNLLHSQADDYHYAVRRDENDVAWIEFGDGRYGHIPRRGRNNITAFYRIGGGAQGNVAAKSITKAVTRIANLERVFNGELASGGADAEPIEEAARRGPRLFRTMQRAVTASDYEAHALNFGVAKARARSPGWNRIELFIAPAGGGQPSDTLKADLRHYFEDKRMLTSFVEICDPLYVKVSIEGMLAVEPYYSAEQVQQQAVAAVSKLLALDQVDFAMTLYLSKVYEAIEAIEGVHGVNITRFARTSAKPDLPGDGKLRFGWAEIPCLDSIQLHVPGLGL